MATFQKPESALKRAEELIQIGKDQDALETLHAALQHKKFKNLWTTTIESIMVRHLQLCVDLKQMRMAREGLYQYRTMCQAANIGSLEHVVQKFRDAAEAKVAEAQKQQEIKMSDMADLDENEAPQTILLRAIQASDTRQQSQDRDVHIHYRFLWDAYKVVLDVLKSNAKMEECYHETAKHAFNFCQANQRPQEFKRLCDTLRKNYQDLHKHTGKTAQHQVNPNNVDTITRTLETRVKQLQTATELDLWRESYVTAGEIYELISKARPKPHLRSMYYGYLGQIFWKSENYLFHAFACVKNLMFVKAAKQNLSSDELQSLASKAVLATLCVPFQKDSGMQSSLELTSDGGSSAFEKAKKHAALFSAQSVPTRESICNSLIEKGLLQLSAEPCQKLFALVESEFTPLSLCQDAKPFLDEIGKGELFDGVLTQYVTPLKQIIFFRLMKQLSEVYSNMTIDNFEQAASIVPFNIAEKWMANAARQHGINIQINYQHQAIVFGAPRKVDMKSMRQPLMEIGYKLQTAMNRVAPEESGKKEKLEKQQLSANIVKRIEEESRQIRQRKEEIERRKEESERKRQEKEKEALERQRRQEAKDAEAEKVRQEEERRRREAERAEQKRKEAELTKNKEMLEQMKKQADTVRAANLKVGGKKITEIEADDLENIGIDQIEKAREAQVLRERQDKIRNRKMESKRVDHLARALREEEVPMLADWADGVEEEDTEFLKKAEEKNVDEQREKHAEELKERDQLIVFQQAKDQWISPQMEEREQEFQEKRNAQVSRLTQKVVDGKIARAKQRLAEERLNEQKKRDQEESRKAAEERLRADEARRAEQEQLEAERRAEEERLEAERREKEEIRRREADEKRREQDEMRARAEAKRLEREREIEARQTAQAAPREAREEVPAWRRGGAPADRAPGAERNQGAARDTGGGSWRTGPPGDKGGAQKEEGGSWRRPAQGGDSAPAVRRPAQGGDSAPAEEGSWRSSAPRGAPTRAPAPQAPAREPARENPPARPPARDDPPAEDDGWGVVSSGKRRTGGGGGRADQNDWRSGGGAPAPQQSRDSRAPGAGRGDDGGSWRAPGGPRAAPGGDSEKRPVPPWKRNANNNP
eukprot:CAMPEP_0197620830 /NCGR_PEP_ID=MMETSP1338-20131121/1561_1 /TAXON_ID=43686 ORGANISM="Pelagodinium beii, Strain RCC1491" /NCGR_SAMPLE_ID=MMETSP1338 /ASSEMBLY_ACC=CAM_ASM_000754 /LENGTH=1106 /DNA_ID=CAMNT_0043190115 /DNA_START=66 /DNA_END=3386 /DNA_ORIENTATION=-